MLDNLKRNKNKIIIESLVFLFFIMLSVLFAHKSSLLNCGFFFADDHEIVRINETIHSNGFLKAMFIWMSADIHLRFRPVYWIFRVTESLLFGSHVFLWHLAKALEIGFCSYLMYFFARKMGKNYFISILFSLVTFIGEQCAVVFRLGPQEPLALIWLFFSLIFCVYYSERKSKFNFLCLFLSLLLMMLTKESFLLLVPAVLLFLFYLNWKKESQFDGKTFFAPFLQYKWLVIISMCAFFVCMAVIVFYCGTDSTGYAGFSSDDTIKAYIDSILNIWKNSLKIYLIIFVISFGLSLLGICLKIKKDKADKKRSLFLFLCELAFVLYFILTQSLLHAKSGMTERYLLPCISGIFIYVFIFTGNYLSSQKLTSCFHQFLLLVMFFVLAVKGNVYQKTSGYALECIYNMQMLDTVKQMTASHENEETPVIVSTQHGEWNMAVCAFLQELYGIHNVYALSQSSEDDIAYDRYTVGEEDKNTELPLEHASIYIAQSEYLPFRLQEKGILDGDVEQQIVGYYIVYNKK